MNIKDALAKGIRILKTEQIEAPAVDAGVILCDVIGCDKSFLYVHGDEALAPQHKEGYFSKLELRAKGMPVQYITGHQEFMSLDFSVGPQVLIPRQDTEILVEEVIKYADAIKRRRAARGTAEEGSDGQVRVLDMGTGSGCIAISLAYYISNAFVVAADISSNALEIAGNNASLLGVDGRISFICSDLFEGLYSPEGGHELFDIIVSNPPYISLKEIGALQREVRDYEPAGALYGGDDGLDFYRKITAGACEFLKDDGLLAFEVGHRQSKEVAAMMKYSYHDICIVNDLSGIGRVVTGKANKLLKK